MGELRSALDVLAGEDVHAMFGPQLLERLLARQDLVGLNRDETVVAARVGRQGAVDRYPLVRLPTPGGVEHEEPERLRVRNTMDGHDRRALERGPGIRP